jgi:hypothetical protein
MCQTSVLPFSSSFHRPQHPPRYPLQRLCSTTTTRWMSMRRKFLARNQPAPTASLLPASADLVLDPRAPAPTPLATISHQLPAAGLKEAVPHCRHESIAFPAPRPCDRELPHERLARQEESAARLAALTSLPPSPTLLQEARDEALAVFLALGTSLPPSVTTADTRRDVPPDSSTSNNIIFIL